MFWKAWSFGMQPASAASRFSYNLSDLYVSRYKEEWPKATRRNLQSRSFVSVDVQLIMVTSIQAKAPYCIMKMDTLRSFCNTELQEFALYLFRHVWLPPCPSVLLVPIFQQLEKPQNGFIYNLVFYSSKHINMFQFWLN